MIDLNLLCRILWRPFIKEIETGDPVYFCFYRDLIAALISGTEFSHSDPVMLINKAAGMLCEVSANHAELKPHVLLPGENNFSYAIILVAQQVLAVEEMVKEKSGYTENAYFPRLRKMMSLFEESQNPFSFEDFEQIWMRLSQEIRSVSGSTNNSVTFRFGVEQGVNKAKSFPLSQALLSRDDLYSLGRKIGSERVRLLKRDELWSEMRREKNQLKRRSQGLMRLFFLKDRIVEQAFAFFQRVDVSGSADRELSLQVNAVTELRVHEETIDWESKEYRAYLYIPGTRTRLDSEIHIKNDVRKSILQSGFLILPLGELKDYWTRRPSLMEVLPGERFIILGSRSELKRAIGILISLNKDCGFDSDNCISLSFHEEIRIAEFIWPEFSASGLLVRNGRLVGNSKPSEARNYRWNGGLRLFEKFDKFLIGYLPEGVSFKDESYNIHQLLEVNGRVVDSNIFLKSLEELEGSQEYTLTFPGERLAKLIVTANRSDENDRMGFLFDDAGRLLPLLERVTVGDEAAVGFNVPQSSIKRVSPSCFSRVLADLRSGRGDALTDSLIAKIISQLRESAVPLPVKLVIEKLLVEKRCLSAEVLESFGLSV